MHNFRERWELWYLPISFNMYVLFPSLYTGTTWADLSWWGRHLPWKLLLVGACYGSFVYNIMTVLLIIIYLVSAVKILFNSIQNHQYKLWTIVFSYKAHKASMPYVLEDLWNTFFFLILHENKQWIFLECIMWNMRNEWNSTNRSAEIHPTK